MAESQAMVAAEVNAVIDFSPYRTLLDVGGGHGTFLAKVAELNSALQLQLFDLPAVAEQAKTELQKAGLNDRATVFGGSFFADPLPRGADLVSLVRILHDHDDEPAAAILKAVFEFPAGRRPTDRVRTHVHRRLGAAY